MRGALYIAALGICIVVIYELVRSRSEGFISSGSGSDPSNPIWAQFVPARADVGENREEEGYIADKRYFHGYVDIQRLGMRRDYCRMVVPKGGDEKDAFFACALAGTENLSSVQYRTKSLREGFLRSRDNYMRDVFGESRDSYCSIIKVGADSFQARCYRAGDLTFNKTDVQDTEPPKDIQQLLGFYEGIMMWYRLYDDMRDYAHVSFATTAGALEINEAPDQSITKGLEFNGTDQFLRLAETKNLKFGDKTPNRFMRAFSMWVYFDEFTNNAHIFDFGNGAGQDNVFLGIIGRGNAGIQTNEIRDSILCRDQSTLTVPEAPSGAQDVPTVHPKKLMLTSDANCNDFNCKAPAVFGRRMATLQPPATPANAGAQTADLLYEVWDGKVRTMRVKLNNAVQLKTWTHIAITAKNNDAFQPDIQFWINGELFYTKPAGSLPRTNYTDHNYLGKSNWVAVTSQYENQDELFKGSMFDFRVYKTPMTSRKIKTTYAWGREKLGLGAQTPLRPLSNESSALGIQTQSHGSASNVMLYEDINLLSKGTATGKTFISSK